MWFILSLLCAVSLSFADLFAKIALRHADIFLVSWVKMAFAFVILLAALPFIRIPSISGHFVRICLVLFPLEVLVQLLYMKAIQVSPLSLTIPFLALSPIFLIATSFLMLGERIDRSGLMGILLIALGSYMLNIDKAAYGFLSPLKAIRSKCLDCCCGSIREVALCPSTTCSLWPYRFGKRRRAQQIVAQERQIGPVEDDWWAERLEDYTSQSYYGDSPEPAGGGPNDAFAGEGSIGEATVSSEEHRPNAALSGRLRHGDARAPETGADFGSDHPSTAFSPIQDRGRPYLTGPTTTVLCLPQLNDTYLSWSKVIRRRYIRRCPWLTSRWNQVEVGWKISGW